MNKEIIEHWKTIINAVFRAEDAIKGAWIERLNQTRNADNETKQKIADGYITAIAEEILSKTKQTEVEGD